MKVTQRYISLARRADLWDSLGAGGQASALAALRGTFFGGVAELGFVVLFSLVACALLLLPLPLLVRGECPGCGARFRGTVIVGWLRWLFIFHREHCRRSGEIA